MFYAGRGAARGARRPPARARRAGRRPRRAADLELGNDRDRARGHQRALRRRRDRVHRRARPRHDGQARARRREARDPRQGPQRHPGLLPGARARLRAAFDEEGFYRSGDAGRLVDERDPNQGVLFDGRIAEDFKLLTGTWVTAGTLRLRLLSAAKVLSDAVICGHDRDYVAALAWINQAEARKLLGAGRRRRARRPAAAHAPGRRGWPTLEPRPRAPRGGSSACCCWPSRRASMPARSPTRATSTSAPACADAPSRWRCCTARSRPAKIIAPSVVAPDRGYANLGCPARTLPGTRVTYLRFLLQAEPRTACNDRRVGGRSQYRFVAFPVACTAAMDPVDETIVALLREDARRSYLDIGRHVHLSAPAVKRRVDRLERDGVILGYTAIVDPTAFGWNAEAFVDLYCEGDVSGEAIKRAVEPEPGVLSAHTVAGEASALPACPGARHQEPRAGARADPRRQGGQSDSHPGGAVDAVYRRVGAARGSTRSRSRRGALRGRRGRRRSC